MRKIIVILPLLFLIFSKFVFAESCSPGCALEAYECQKKIEECAKLIELSAKATTPHEQKMKDLEANINVLEDNIKSLSTQIDKKQKTIASNLDKIAVRQEKLNSQARTIYKIDNQSVLEYILSAFFSGKDFNQIIKDVGFRQNIIEQEKKEITAIVINITDLTSAKKQLEDTQSWLTDKKASLEITLAPIKKLVTEAKAYQSKLTQTLGALSSRQQELINAKLGSLNLSRSANISLACADDRNIDPGFSPRFAFYTFGIPHRVGMSQFGAFGRANTGQNYHDILNAYFSGISFDKRSNINISVDGFGSMSLEQYMLGIYEVPDGWPMEVLKAQAVAARSYALAYTNNGSSSICTSQSCQVYKGGNKGGNWEQAVKQTEGEVMTNGGTVIKAWFSSTDGGYTHTSSEVFGGSAAWTKNLKDTSGDINNISDLFSKAYDRDSPCFYNAQGWRTQYNKSAWLKSDEVADIVNVIMLSANNNMIDTLSADQVKSQLGNRAFNRIDDVSMSFDLGSGKTTNVHITGDAGSKDIDGTTFKNYFNLRAPANIAIVGPLYNIEKK